MSQAPAGPAPQPVVAFSTIGLPREQRIEMWEHHNEAALIALRCRTLDSSDLDATEITTRVDRLHLARVQGSSHVVERDARTVERRPTGAVALFFSLAGDAFFYHDDGVRSLRPGQVLLCDADRPFLRGFSRGLEELVLTVPREVFAEVTGIAEVAAPEVHDFAGPGAAPAAHALAAAVGRAVREQGRSVADEPRLLGLVAALTGSTIGGTAATHLAAVRAHVELHLTDPHLSAASTAAAVGLSTRHLSRVLAEAGDGFPGYVLGRRLEHARRLLEQPGGALTVAEAARRSGFASPSHFSGSFRARFGETAADVRRRAQARPPAG